MERLTWSIGCGARLVIVTCSMTRMRPGGHVQAGGQVVRLAPGAWSWPACSARRPSAPPGRSRRRRPAWRAARPCPMLASSWRRTAEISPSSDGRGQADAPGTVRARGVRRTGPPDHRLAAQQHGPHAPRAPACPRRAGSRWCGAARPGHHARRVGIEQHQVGIATDLHRALRRQAEQPRRGGGQHVDQPLHRDAPGATPVL